MHGLHILQLPLHPHLPKKPKEDIDFHFFNSNANYHVMSYLFLIYLYVHHFVIKVEDIFKPYVNLLQNFYYTNKRIWHSAFNSVRYTSQHFVCGFTYVWFGVCILFYISCHVTNCVGSSLVIGHQSLILYQNDILLTATLLAVKCRVVVFSFFVL